jgi:type IV pilus assembly protein PilV
MTHNEMFKTFNVPKSSKYYSNGFTLLEILVAIIVLSFGLLGMVGIQAMALKSNSDAKQQSAAVQFASELSDMMRGNKAVAVETTPANNPYIIDFKGGNITAPTEYCSSLAGCSSAINVAQWEKYDWLSRLNTTFPGARVEVCYDDAPYDTDGLPQWGCNGTASAGGPISIKIGWTRDSTNKTRISTGATVASTNNATAFDVAKRPSVTYIVIPGASS